MFGKNLDLSLVANKGGGMGAHVIFFIHTIKYFGALPICQSHHPSGVLMIDI